MRILLRNVFLLLSVAFILSSCGGGGGSAAGSGTESTSSESTTLTLTAPSSVVAVAGDRQIALSWNPVASATSYRLKRSATAGGPYTQTAAPTSAAHTETGLSNGSRYYYVVTAVSSAGESANSNEVSATPVEPAPVVTAPTPPSGLHAVAANGAVSLSWTVSATAASYTLKRSATSNGPYTVIAQISASASAAYTDSGLINGARYYYVVTAVNAVGESADSNEVSATPTAPAQVVTAPTAPSSLQAVAANAAISLSWTASATAASYTLKRSATSGGPYTVIAQIAASASTAYTNSGLVNGTRYYYVVSASNSAGESANSPEAAATPVLPAVAAPAITAQPQNASVAVGQSATFTVVATGTPAPTYQWQVSTDGSFWANVSTGTGLGSASYTTAATSPSDNAKRFRVVISNSAGSATSNNATLTVGAPLTIPIITYSPSAFSFTVNTATATVTPKSTGGTVASWNITPALPTGLSFSTVTGQITGTPTTASTTKTYTVIATNTAGNATATLSITVGTGGVPSVVAQASRSNGVAPLYVQFNADLFNNQSFSDNEYIWDFGDSLSGSWGTTGKSKNSAKGPVAAHVFEKPGTYKVSLRVRNSEGELGQSTYTITVDDPDTYYAGTKTICVSRVGDFSGAPAGAQRITTSDLSTIAPLATAGTRILFHRGESWTTAGLTNWPENSGPITLGAFGAGTSPDALGIYSNAPEISVTSGSFLPMDSKQDWRVVDLNLIDPSRSATSMGGAMEMQRWLFLRLKIKGFDVGLGWSRWNTSRLMVIKEMAVVSCDISDSNINAMFLGGEQIALMGNKAYDARTSHVTRVYTSYIGVISHNEFSGASLDNTNGRHALKLHGPKETEIGAVNSTGNAAHRSQFTVISDNSFGGSGPWPIMIAPQDSGSDERISHVIFERNRYHAGFGSQKTAAQIGVRIVAQEVTVRNNIFDGSNAATDFTGISVERDGPAPAPVGTEIYNNTIYRSDNAYGNHRTGIKIGSAPTLTTIKNNLVSFPATDASIQIYLVNSASGSITQSNNLLAPAPSFIDANNASPLLRNFKQTAGAPGINQGVSAPVFEDFNGSARTNGIIDLGAYEY